MAVVKRFCIHITRYVIQIKKEKAMKYLKSNGIETKIHYEKIFIVKDHFKKLKIPFKLDQTDKII